jgi:hypothetical protein
VANVGVVQARPNVETLKLKEESPESLPAAAQATLVDQSPKIVASHGDWPSVQGCAGYSDSQQFKKGDGPLHCHPDRNAVIFTDQDRPIPKPSAVMSLVCDAAKPLRQIINASEA